MDRFENVPGYPLLFKKPAYEVPAYDYYGTRREEVRPTKTVREGQKAQDFLVTSVKLIKIGDQDALTLDTALIENTDFFLQALRTIDPHFIAAELRVEKQEAKDVMNASVLKSPDAEAPVETDNNRNDKKKVRPQDIFFTLNERDLKSSSVTANDFRSRTSQYSKMGTGKTQVASQDTEVFKDKSKLTLAQVLSHIFEKAINVQFQEFQGRLGKQHQEFFFTNADSSHFATELKLAKFWRELSASEREKVWAKVTLAQDDIIEEIKKSPEFANSMQFEEIQEEPE